MRMAMVLRRTFFEQPVSTPRPASKAAPMLVTCLVLCTKQACLASPGIIHELWNSIPKLAMQAMQTDAKDLEVFTLLERAFIEMRRKRSEERRVGKECRYRWSP